jgi:AcrR family transcriptional regulator
MWRTAILLCSRRLGVPRVSAEHEQAVRARIVDAAIKVFGEFGYARASIQDVVRESGLSVGAVYSYFKGKEDLFVVACACEADREATELRLRLAELGSVSDRLTTAVDWAVDAALQGMGAKGALAQAWSQAAVSPEVREILRAHRDGMVEFSRCVLQDAIARGELPDWIDIDGIAAAFVTLIEGFVVVADESGPISPEEARRGGHSLLELLLAAPPKAPAAVERLRAEAGTASRASG